MPVRGQEGASEERPWTTTHQAPARKEEQIPGKAMKGDLGPTVDRERRRIDVEGTEENRKNEEGIAGM